MIWQNDMITNNSIFQTIMSTFQMFCQLDRYMYYVDLSDNDVDLSDLQVDMSDIMSTFQIVCLHLLYVWH